MLTNAARRGSPPAAGQPEEPHGYAAGRYLPAVAIEYAAGWLKARPWRRVAA